MHNCFPVRRLIFRCVARWALVALQSNQSEQKCLCVKIKSAPRLDNFMPGKLCLTAKVGWLFADFIILLPPQRKRKMNASLSVRNKMCGSAKDEGKNVLNQSERMSLFLFKGSTRNFIFRKIGYLYCFSLLHISWSCCSGHFHHRNNFTPQESQHLLSRANAWQKWQNKQTLLYSSCQLTSWSSSNRRYNILSVHHSVLCITNGFIWIWGRVTKWNETKIDHV